MQDIEEQKVKLEQKKNRLIAEETRLRLKEQKMRTRHLIEIGGASVMNGTALLIILKTSSQNSKHLLVNTILKL